MDELNNEIQNCRLCHDATNSNIIPMPGEGTSQAKILIVCEQPPEDGRYSRSMFTGPSGRTLKEVINLSPVDSDDIFVTSLLKCNMPLDREKMRSSISNCIPYLKRQIEFMDPLIICTLGRKVFQTLTGGRYQFHKYRGTPVKWEGRLYYPVINPPEIFYDYNLRYALEEDFIKLGKLYKDISRNIL